MQYMLLIHSDESLYPKMSEEEMGQLMGAYEKFTADVQAAGVYKASDRLSATQAATTVRVRDGIRRGPWLR